MTDSFAGADSIPERVMDWSFDKHLDNSNGSDYVRGDL